MRLLLCREERDAHRAQLQAICDEFRTAAFERAGRGR
jgi:hypothetical protein